MLPVGGLIGVGITGTAAAGAMTCSTAGDGVVHSVGRKLTASLNAATTDTVNRARQQERCPMTSHMMSQSTSVRGKCRYV